MSFPHAWSRVVGCQSAITEKEGRALWDLGVTANGAIVEVGTWQGKSAALLALASKAGTGMSVSSVDPFAPWVARGGRRLQGDRGLAKHRLTAAGINHFSPLGIYGTAIHGATTLGFLELIENDSVGAVAGWRGGRVGLLFIDGDHTAADIDVEAWWHLLAPGAIIAFHDYDLAVPDFANVVSTVDGLIESGRTAPVALVGTLHVVQRT